MREGLNFKNVNIFSERGPVFDIDNARNVIIDHPAYTPGASLFMKVVGIKSENIQLLNTDTKNAKKDFELGKEVDPKAVIQKNVSAQGQCPFKGSSYAPSRK